MNQETATHGLVGVSKKICDALVDTSMILASICVALIILVNTLDTLGRAFLSKAMVGNLELTEVFLAIVVILSIPYAQRALLHIEIDILSQFFPKKLKMLTTGISLLLSAAVFLLLAVQSYGMAVEAVEVMEVSGGYLPVPVWIGKVFTAVGFAVAFLQVIVQIMEFVTTGKVTKAGQDAVRCE